jgi:uncharacterized FlaG/YvyC family protein
VDNRVINKTEDDESTNKVAESLKIQNKIDYDRCLQNKNKRIEEEIDNIIATIENENKWGYRKLELRLERRDGYTIRTIIDELTRKGFKCIKSEDWKNRYYINWE